MYICGREGVTARLFDILKNGWVEDGGAPPAARFIAGLSWCVKEYKGVYHPGCVDMVPAFFAALGVETLALP